MCFAYRYVETDDKQWRRQLWGTGARAPSTSNNFIFSSLWSKSDCQLSKCCVVCEISWCRCQQHARATALLICTALVIKLSHRAAAAAGPEVRPSVPHDLISSFASPRNKSWRRHWRQKSAVFSRPHRGTFIALGRLYSETRPLD